MRSVADPTVAGLRTAPPAALRLASRTSRAAIAAAVLALAGGCGLFGSSRQPPEPLPAPAADAGVSLQRAWDVSLGAPSGVGFAPMFADASIWAAASDGTVVRIDAATGAVRWRSDAGARLTAGVGTDGSLVAVATRDGAIVAFGADGRRLWGTPIGAEVVNPPAVAAGLVLVRASDNRVIALDAATGTRRWNFQRQNPPLVLRQAGGIAVAGDVAFVGMPGGRIVALDLRSGAPRWDAAFAMPRGTTDIERIADVVGAPVPLAGEVCAVAYQGRIGCLDAASGRSTWARDFSSAAGLDADANGVVSVDASDRVRAFDGRGQPAWERDGFGRRNLSAPVIVGDLVLAGDLQGNVLAFRRSDGRFVARGATDGTAITAPPARTDGLAVFQTVSGGLHALRRQ
jgi:outer membrane protein assembly factor BamB